jgi:hypothetical protein
MRSRQPPAPAASSAKRAVPSAQTQFLTRIAVIEHSLRAVSALLRLLSMRVAFALLRLLPPRQQRWVVLVVASRPERCCQLPEPRRAAPQNKGGSVSRHFP